MHFSRLNASPHITEKRGKPLDVRKVDLEGKKSIVVKMKPSSFIIAAIVKPLHFYMSTDGATLYQIDGRTTVKKNVNGSFKDLDAVTVYTKGVTTAVGTQAPSGGNSK